MGHLAADGANRDRAATGTTVVPDVANWSWHEYGMRVGFWRLHRMFRRLGISPTVTINARVCESYPQVVAACLDSRWELTAHGYEHIPMHRIENQPEAIACHAYLSGSPHRIRHVARTLETIMGREGVVVWNGSAILDWYREQTGVHLRVWRLAARFTCSCALRIAFARICGAVQAPCRLSSSPR
jgi:hypothetical protein